MHFYKPQEKPRKWGSFQDVQYAVMKNCEKIYQVDPDSIVLAMPLFWGLPPLDYSGKNNHGTNHGTTYKDGSLDFDGNVYIDCGEGAGDFDFTSAMTVSGWIKFTTAGGSGNYPGLIAKHYSNTWGALFDGNTRVPKFYLKIGGSESYRGNTACPLDEWCSVFYVYGNGYQKTYVNGTVDLNRVQTGNIETDNTDVTIGMTSPGNYPFPGLINEVRISNIAHTADQIALFYDRPWALYGPVSRPIYFFQAAGEEPSPGPGLMALMI